MVDSSARIPPFEEPEKFNRVLIEEGLPLATGKKLRRGKGLGIWQLLRPKAASQEFFRLPKIWALR
jgi:hypothetical protein